MKKKLLYSAFMLLAIWQTKAQVVNIPDANFKAALIDLHVDLNNNGNIELSEASVVTYLPISRKNISNLTGIEAFSSLESLECDHNLLTSLDLRSNTSLIDLYCNANKLVSIFLNKCVALKNMDCSFNKLTSVDLSHNTQLSSLVCTNNKFNILDVSKNSLYFLICTQNPTLTNICVGSVDYYVNHPSLFFKDATAAWINCTQGDFVNFSDVAFKSALISIGIDRNNNGIIETSEAESTDTLLIANKWIQDLDGIQAFKNLTYLDCSNNYLTALDLFANTQLVKVYCGSNFLTQFKISKYKNTILRTLVITNNKLNELNLRTSTYLDKLWCYNNPLLPSICVADVSKATSNSEYKKDAAATWTNSCGWVAREGIDLEEEVVNAISLYPNPAKENVLVRTDEQVVQISIKSLEGILILQTANQKEVDISSLSTGIYLVDIRTASKTETKKLVVE